MPQNVTTSAAPARRPIPRELAKILADCRDITVHRLLLSFTALLDRVCDMLMERAGKSDVARRAAVVPRSAPGARRATAPTLMAEFEKRLRAHIDDRVSGRADEKADFSKVDATKLTLIDLNTVDESVLDRQHRARRRERSVTRSSITLNRGIGHLLGKPRPRSDRRNPLGPATIVSAFAEALGTLQDRRPRRSSRS